MAWLISLFASLVPAGLRAWLGVKQDQAIAEGVDKEKANEQSTIIANASDARVIDADVDRMSDDSVRNSPYANKRD